MSIEREKKLQVKDLTISFRTVNGKLQAVRDISFDLYKGETLAIVGESGSGKSATSKCILGISAANTLVEGGEILYDGKDLLKISEEDFHAIRGDKIAMVFQDPLSSLNPIMRVGKQLTEAMLLKNKASRRESKKKLNAAMSALNANASGDSKRFATYRSIIKAQVKYEEPYDQAYANAEAALKAADDLLLAIDKEALTDPVTDCRELKTYADASVDRFVVRDGAAVKRLTGELVSKARTFARSKDGSALRATASELRELVKSALDEPKPDFFALGCWLVLGKHTLGNESTAELNAASAPFLTGEFMTDFRAAVKQALTASAEKSASAMTAANGKLIAVHDAFGAKMPSPAEAKKQASELSKAVEAAIDPLETVKDSLAYTFRVSLMSALDVYYKGITKNAAEQKRFDRQTARYQRAASGGKTPEWNVVPLSLVDLELAKENILHIMDNMRSQFEGRLDAKNSVDFDARTDSFLTWLQETAVAEIHRVTRSMAKDTAIRIMEQVGISEARKRYKQYPFEFSGGMRQRIVIAISLTADPDILICDEPTTALDVTIQAQILELINKLKRERNLSVIFITHDLGVVANMADRIAVMYAGKIVEYGTSEDVFYHPAHPYTWALLASIPDLDSKDKLEAIPGTPPNMIYPPKGDAFAARNKYALELDFEEQPPMFQISDTHYAATWLLHPDAPKVEMPDIVKERIQRMGNIGKNSGGETNA